MVRSQGGQSPEGPPPQTRAGSIRRLVEYDKLRNRVWIFGQRCHHGATGSLVATLACVNLVLGPATDMRQLGGPRSMLALAAAGGALMIHDWKDHSVWFAREPGRRS
jgi:hypothetical protein